MVELENQDHHTWVQLNAIDDICTKCGEVAHGEYHGIVYPETICLGDSKMKITARDRV